MGCFDTVTFKCINCGATISIQSKAGPCAQLQYDHMKVPAAIAAVIDGEQITCADCGTVQAIKPLMNVTAVYMTTEDI